MRAAIYARYSSDHQRDASIDDQVRVCKDLISRQGWSLVQVYQDRASSGATMLRAGYQALVQDARAAEFDVIVAEALDRLSRDQEDIAALYKRVSHAGVGIHTAAEGEINELHIGLKGTMNALFLKDLAAKTRRGLRGRVEAGKSGGGLTYGYDVISRLDGTGELVRGERAVNAAEAEIVRGIFRDYAVGLSPKRIALALNERGIAGPRGGLWAPTTINGNRDRGTGILNNELYAGRLVWNKLNYSKDPETGKRRSRVNASGKVITTEVPELRIVDDALWQAARDRQGLLDDKVAARAGGSPHGVREKRRPQTLFSGLMCCGCCGGGFSKTGARHFGCSTARNKGPTACTNMLTVRQDRLEAQVLGGLRERLMDPDLFQIFAREFTAEWNRLQSASIGDRTEWQSGRKRLAAQIDRLVDAITEGKAVASVTDRLAKLEVQMAELDRKLAEAPLPVPQLHPNLPDIYRRKVAALTDALAADGGQSIIEGVRGLVDEIRLTPDGGALRIELHGELAAIIALGSGTDGAVLQQQARSATSLARQVKVVAGTGFEPVTFRL